MKTLESIIEELRQLLTKGLDVVFLSLKETLNQDTDTYQDLLAVEGRYNDVCRQLLLGVVSNEESNVEINKIRQGLLKFIDNLQKKDIKELKDDSNVMADIYNGEVLYRIPKKMQVGAPEECIVRLAFDRDKIIKDFALQEGDVLKDLRIGDVMGVELIDPRAEKVFEIQTIHDEVQFIDKNVATEWIFTVTPLKLGEFSLVLKISIIEIIDGSERKRNEVLKEQVEIVTSRVNNKKGKFKDSKLHWQLVASGTQIASTSEVKPDASKKSKINYKSALIFAGIIGTVTAIAALTNYIFTKRAGLEPDPVVTDSVSAITLRDTFKQTNKDTLVKTSNCDSLYQIIIKSRHKRTIDKYLLDCKYPDSVQMRLLLDTIELTFWNDVKKKKQIALIDSFLKEFPNSRYVNEAKDLRGKIRLRRPQPPQNQRTIQADSIASKPPNEIQTKDSAVRIASYPVFKGCKDNNKDIEFECSKKEITDEIIKQYKRLGKSIKITENVIVILKFDVDTGGKIKNPDVGQLKNEELSTLITRIVSKLDKFRKPGIDANGIPTEVRIEIPLAIRANQ